MEEPTSRGAREEAQTPLPLLLRHNDGTNAPRALKRNSTSETAEESAEQRGSHLTPASAKYRRLRFCLRAASAHAATLSSLVAPPLRSSRKPLRSSV